MSDEPVLTQQNMFALYDIDEMSKFKNISTLEDFVNKLTPDRQQRLAKWLSEWRENDVHDFIHGHAQGWKRELVPVEQIIVRSIPCLDLLLKRHRNRLHLIANDAEILQHEECASQGEIERMEFIANRDGHDFLLMDGNHRAIKLAADGEKTLSLVYPE